MLSSVPQPLRAHSSITSATRCICGPSGLSWNPPCGFQLLEPPLPFLVLFVPQDCVQYLGRVRMELGPFFSRFWLKLLIHHHLVRHCKALFKPFDYVGPKFVLVPFGSFHYAWSPLSAVCLESPSSASCASLLRPRRGLGFSASCQSPRDFMAMLPSSLICAWSRVLSLDPSSSRSRTIRLSRRMLARNSSHWPISLISSTNLQHYFLFFCGKETFSLHASRPVVQEFSRTPVITGDRVSRLQAGAGCVGSFLVADTKLCSVIRGN